MSKKNINQFSHLKIHTQYSICEGAVKIKELKDYCKKNSIQTVGLSDTKNLCGALEFSENISSVGTQPIIGSQIYFNFKNYIGYFPVIANTIEGYKNIISLSSKSYLENKTNDNPHCLFQDLLAMKEGITVFTGSLNGIIGSLYSKNLLSEIDEILKSLRVSFGDKFYIEIQRHNDIGEKNFEEFLLKKSNDFQIPLIATQEVFYLEKDMHEAHDALICIGEKTYVNEKKRTKYSNEHYLKNSEEMFKIFSDLPEALENNINFPIKCIYKPKTSSPLLPNIKTKQDIDIDDELLNLATVGLKKKFQEYVLENNSDLKNKENLKIYEERLKHEFTIIKEMRYSGYFLIVSDYIKWAKNNKIPVGPGRGSGAGSLIAWSLDITDIDPIKFNLIFERFLNPDRISMPDFDIDFCEEKRDLVFGYLKKKYGNGVAHIITFGKLKARMAIRDIGRVLGFPYGFVDSISKMIPFDPSRPISLQDCIDGEPRIKDMISKDDRVKKLMDLSLKLEGLNRNIATHAAGVVIAEKNLSETVPLYKDNSSNLLLPATQFDMYSAENAGLVKFDLLGLKTLTTLNKTQEILRKKKINIDINKINFEDQKVFDLLSSGYTVGLFQLESAGMREALTQMKPNRLEDIIALVALYRPGPMNNIPIYNDCKHKRKEPDYLHPKLKEILEPTYGVIIYQEQVMQIAQVLSGFTAGEADILRRAMGKKKKAELEKQKQRFIEGALKNNIEKDVAEYIFQKIEPFAQYGFNKSHAAAYAVIAYQTAYLKTYYTKEFFAASMSMELNNQNKLSEFFEELKRLNISVQRPCINKCFSEFKSTENNFYYALGAIKSVGLESIKQIVKEREEKGQYRSIDDFINRVDPKSINKLQLEGLVKSGSFDSLEKNRKAIFDSIPNLILSCKSAFENRSNSQINLFDEKNVVKNNMLLSTDNNWSFNTQLSLEFESMGFFISDHPINQYKGVFDIYKIQNFNSFLNSSNNEATLAATVMKVQEKKTQKGNPFAIVKFSDLGGVFELFIFSNILELNREILKVGKPVLITILRDISNQDNRFKRISVRKLVDLDEINNQSIPKITLEINEIESLEKLSSLISEKGSTNVHIIVQENSKNLIFELSEKRKINPKILKSLKNEPYLKRII